MDVTQRQRFLVETIAAREKAEATVQGLIQAREECERQLTQARKKDVLRSVTGRSAMDKAITDAQRMVQSLERAIDEVRKQLAAHAGDLLAEGIAPIVRARAAEQSRTGER
jgi:hypothetical protein